MGRFTERIAALRAAGEAVAPEDCFVRVSDNLSHLPTGNGTFGVSIMRERDEPLPESEWEPGANLYDETVMGAVVGPFDDLNEIDWR